MPEGPLRVEVTLVCGGRFHDFDHARLRLLELLALHPQARTHVAEDYRDIAAITSRPVLVTYTCDVRPTIAEQEALRAWVAGGGRWLALHGTNSALDLGPGGVDAPRVLPVLAETLGSQFVAHPPIAPYMVEVTDPHHPLVEGITPFEVSDELYLSELHGPLQVLLHTRWSGEARGFVESSWPDDDLRPVLYLRPLDAGCVLYLTLGHCRGHYDMQPAVDWYPRVERGSWDVAEYTTVLARAVGWALNEEPSSP